MDGTNHVDTLSFSKFCNMYGIYGRHRNTLRDALLESDNALPGISCQYNDRIHVKDVPQTHELCYKLLPANTFSLEDGRLVRAKEERPYASVVDMLKLFDICPSKASGINKALRTLYEGGDEDTQKYVQKFQFARGYGFRISNTEEGKSYFSQVLETITPQRKSPGVKKEKQSCIVPRGLIVAKDGDPLDMVPLRLEYLVSNGVPLEHAVQTIATCDTYDRFGKIIARKDLKTILGGSYGC